ncbi:MAG TPA: acetylxylan esterase [Myxococcota bacterium]|nr:acetylxylan esterase [Myxococcota bacterium]
MAASRPAAGAAPGVKVLERVRAARALAAGPGGLRALAEAARVNVRESRVRPYELPPLLVSEAGAPVATAADWPARRAELLAAFRRDVYGVPPAGPRLAVELESEARVFDGRALRRELRLFAPGHPERPALHLLLHRPAAAAAPVPAFLGLNFRGNHAIHPDPGIRLSTAWIEADDEGGVVDHRATEGARGARCSRWPVEAIVARGYALATAYYGDLAPDHPALWRSGLAGDDVPAGSGAIAAWAWGLSRLLDALEAEPGIDAARVALVGHSRLGKAALWAAAEDARFALAISNASGRMGAALTRRRFGESVAFLNLAFPHWMAPRFHDFSHDEDALAVDQHQLLALVAPRPLYVASAEGDAWADPRGSWLAARAAAPAWRLLGVETGDALEAEAALAAGRPVVGPIGHHLRRGGHDLAAEDWGRFLDFADRHLGGAEGRA